MNTIEQINKFHENGLTADQCADLFRKLADEIDGVVVFGAMHVGMKIKQALEEYSINVLFYLDEIEKFDELDGLKVIHSFDETLEKIGGGCSKDCIYLQRRYC